MDRIGRNSPLRWYLREWRLHKGVTAERLAERLETNKGQISKLENGRQRMNDEWIIGYAQALDIEPRDLLRDPKSPDISDLLAKATADQVKKIREIAEIIIGKTAA